MKTTSDFYDSVYAFTAEMEGGLTDNPHDAGGITNYGVSLAFLADFARNNAGYLSSLGVRLPVTRQSVIGLARGQAREIFRKAFWIDPKIMQLARPLAAATFDAAVNHGPGRGIRFCQQALNGYGAKLSVDGIIGPLTLKAANAPKPTNAALLAIEKRRAFYHSIVNANPSQKVFLRGWLNRADKMERFVKNL